MTMWGTGAWSSMASLASCAKSSLQKMTFCACSSFFCDMAPQLRFSLNLALWREKMLPCFRVSTLEGSAEKDVKSLGQHPADMQKFGDYLHTVKNPLI